MHTDMGHQMFCGKHNSQLALSQCMKATSIYGKSMQVQGLLAAYEDVLLRISAAGNLEEISRRLQTFIQLEASAEVGSTSISPEVSSWELEELTYRVVATVK